MAPALGTFDGAAPATAEHSDRSPGKPRSRSISPRPDPPAGIIGRWVEGVKRLAEGNGNGTSVRNLNVPLDFVWKIVAFAVAAYAAVWWSNAGLREDLREIKASQTYNAQLQLERSENLRRESDQARINLTERLTAMDKQIASAAAEARMAQVNVQELMRTILTKSGSR